MDNINLDLNLLDTQNIKKFFLGANTPFGFISYFDQLCKLKKNWYHFFIKGGPGTGKSMLMKSIVKKIKNSSKDLEIIYCSSDPNSLDGVIINDKKISIFDATPPHVLEPTFPGAFEKTISICDCWCDKILYKNQKEIIDLSNENKFYQKQVVNLLLASYGLLNNNFDIINQYLDKTYLDKYINKIIDQELKFLNNKINNNNIKNLEQKRFLSAISVGDVIFYQNTIDIISEKVYVIKDQYGAVSNYLLSKIKNKLLNSNIDIITCYCPAFGDKKIDHILVPSLKLAFTTSNNYHSYSNYNNIFKYIDEKEFFIYKNKDLEEHLNLNIKKIKDIIFSATNFVKEAKKIHDMLEKIYSSAVDFNLVDQKTKETLQMIEYL